MTQEEKREQWRKQYHKTKERLKENKKANGARYYAKNRERELVKQKEWYEKNKDSARWNRLKNQYGISQEEYQQLYTLQEGKCAICSISQEELRQPLSVDHCHITNKVRGLLCNHCNHGIGKFKDDITILQNAINYLKNVER